MTRRFERFKARALARAKVRAEYDRFAEEFELLGAEEARALVATYDRLIDELCSQLRA